MYINEEFFYKDLVKTINEDCTVLDTSSVITESSVFCWQVYFAVVAVWTIVYFCIWKGVKNSSYVVWVTVPVPLIFIFIMVANGFTLEGSMLGVRMYLLGHN